MNNILSISNLRKNRVGYLIDIFAVFCVYFIPTLSHLSGVPLYLFEPMRVFIILALLHSNMINAYILAFTLPVFSFAIASHPVFLKSIIMSVELVLNVFLYKLLVQKKVAAHWSILLSVISSKLVYYLLKFLLIQFMLFQSETISTPIYIQVIMTCLFGVYTFLIIQKKLKNQI
jgi:hypothetical protein